MTEPANEGSAGRQGRRPQRARARGAQPRSRQQQASQVPAGHLAVGVIIGAHGIRGDVTVEPYTDFPDQRFAEGESVLLGQEMEIANIVTSRPHKGR